MPLELSSTYPSSGLRGMPGSSPSHNPSRSPDISPCPKKNTLHALPGNPKATVHKHAQPDDDPAWHQGLLSPPPTSTKTHGMIHISPPTGNGEMVLYLERSKKYSF